MHQLATPLAIRSVDGCGFRVARWFVFKPKIQIWVNLEGLAIEDMKMVYFMDTWSILRSFVIFYGQLAWFVVIWYIFFHFGILY
jgi:hypothetical protein